MKNVISVREIAIVLMGVVVAVAAFVASGMQTQVHAQTMCAAGEDVSSSQGDDLYVVGCSGVL